MKCPSCGAQIDDDSVFCTVCGKGIEKVEGKEEVKAPPEEEKVESKPSQGGFSGLSITSLIAGILSLIFSLISLAMLMNKLIVQDPLTPIFNVLTYALIIGAIVCGAIDLNKIKKGKSTRRSEGFDIAGIVLGAVSLIQLWLGIYIFL